MTVYVVYPVSHVPFMKIALSIEEAKDTLRYETGITSLSPLGIIDTDNRCAYLILMSRREIPHDKMLLVNTVANIGMDITDYHFRLMSPFPEFDTGYGCDGTLL